MSQKESGDVKRMERTRERTRRLKSGTRRWEEIG